MTSLPALREAVAKEDQQMPSEIAIATAAQCWCDPRTETREMDVELATVFAERVDAWIETARQHAHNEEYYRGLLDRIGERVGPSAYVSDDGSVQDSFLRAKMPDLVSALLDELERLRAVEADFHQLSDVTGWHHGEAQLALARADKAEAELAENEAEFEILHAEIDALNISVADLAALKEQP